jgi:hypothetical protein
MSDARENNFAETIIDVQDRLNKLIDFEEKSSKGEPGVFISYSHSDGDIVEKIRSTFDIDKINYWLDDKDILIGQVIDKAISEGIQRCWIFIVILTPTSIKSKWVEREFDEASHEEIEGDKIIIPVIAKGLEIKNLPARIRRKNCANISNNFAEGYTKIKESIFTYIKERNKNYDKFSLLPTLIRNQIKYSLGKEWKSLTHFDIFSSLSSVVMKLLIDEMLQTALRYRVSASKHLYYLSMEFLIGQSLEHNLNNLGILDQCRDALATMGIDLEQLYTYETEPPLGQSGVGRLAACFLDSLATLNQSTRDSYT